MASDTAKIVTTFYDKALEQLNQDNSYARMVEVDSIPAATMCLAQ